MVVCFFRTALTVHMLFCVICTFRCCTLLFGFWSPGCNKCQFGSVQSSLYHGDMHFSVHAQGADTWKCRNIAAVSRLTWPRMVCFLPFPSGHRALSLAPAWILALPSVYELLDDCRQTPLQDPRRSSTCSISTPVHPDRTYCASARAVVFIAVSAAHTSGTIHRCHKHLDLAPVSSGKSQIPLR